MKHSMFAVHDTKAGAFLPPFIFHAEGMAKRVFADCVNDPKHAFGRHPEDYTLFRIAEYDDRTGTVTKEPAPVSLGNGVTFLEVERDGSFVLEEPASA